MREATDGKKVVMDASNWAKGEDADAVWRNLKQVELRPFQQNKVAADTDNPLRATLKGKVSIRVNVGGNAGDQADVSELKLVREKNNARWKIDPAEVERTFKSRNKPN